MTLADRIREAGHECFRRLLLKVDVDGPGRTERRRPTRSRGSRWWQQRSAPDCGRCAPGHLRQRLCGAALPYCRTALYDPCRRRGKARVRWSPISLARAGPDRVRDRAPNAETRHRSSWGRVIQPVRTCTARGPARPTPGGKERCRKRLKVAHADLELGAGSVELHRDQGFESPFLHRRVYSKIRQAAKPPRRDRLGKLGLPMMLGQYREPGCG